MFPHHPNTNNFDVRRQSVNVPGQNSYRVPRQESSSYGFPECHLPWQGSPQAPGEQQLGSDGRGTFFSDAKSRRQQQQLHETHWQDHRHSQELDLCRLQNMQQGISVEFPQTSYSALLHGPDTPPAQPEPAWMTPMAKGENSGTADGSRLTLKGVTGTPVKSFMEGTQGSSSTQHFLQDQLKNKLKISSGPGAKVSRKCDIENVGEKTQLHLISGASSEAQGKCDLGPSQRKGPGLPDQKWDGQSSSGPSETANIASLRSGQNMITDLERRDGNHSQLQSQGAPPEESIFKQQVTKVLPYGKMPNNIDLQHYNSWNAMQPSSISRAFGNHLQHPADAHYNGWGTYAWQGGQSMDHTSCLPYASGSMNMAPIHAQYGWQPQSAAMVADGFSQFYPEGYYSSGNSFVRQGSSFGGVGESSAFPSPFESHGHYQRSQVYHTPPNQFAAGVGMPVNGACWNEFSGPHSVSREDNKEKIVRVGGQVQPQKLECGTMRGPSTIQPASKKVVKSRQEMTLESVLDAGADQGSVFHEKDAELEGPQVKKQRDFSEVNTSSYHINNCQPSTRFPPQPTSDEFDRAFQRPGLPQSEFIPGVQFVFSAKHSSQESPTINGYFPRASAHIREESFLSGRNLNRTDLSGMSTSQDQKLSDFPRKQSGDQAQAPFKSSMYQQSRTSVGLETSFSETGMLSYAATQELTESQCTAVKPVGGLDSVFTSTMRDQDVIDDHSGYGNPGHDHSFTVNGGEHVISYFNPEVEGQLPTCSGHPSQLQAHGQMPETNEFACSKAGPSQNSVHFRGFSRPAMGKFYPPPPFQSHPVHSQRERTRLAKTRSEDQTLSEARAPRIFESAVLASGMKEFVCKPVNKQASFGTGMYNQPPADESIEMRNSLSVTELEGVRQQGLLSSEGGSVNNHHPENTIYTHAQFPDQILANNDVRGTHSRSMTVDSQGSAGPLHGLTDNEELRASQPSAYAGTMVSCRDLVNSTQINGDQQQSGYYSDHFTVGMEHPALRDGKPTRSSRVGSEKLIRHQFVASKSNLRPPAALHPKKRKKPVPYLLPWHIVAAQPRGQLPSISKAELMWASAANRLPEKDGGDVPNLGIFRADSRLRLTTQLIQHILSPPLPSGLMHGNQRFILECGVYNIAKLALGEACRLMAGAEKEMDIARKGIDSKTMASHGQTRMWNLAKEAAMARLVERFVEKIKRLNFELSRLDCSMSVLGLKGKCNDAEKLSIVHRLGKHHGTEFAIDLSEHRFIEAVPSYGPGLRRFPPQKYVVAVPMPRTVPEGVRCLSL